MKALSVREPWATLIATGAKTVETRTWRTSYRGRLLICASSTPRLSMAGYAVAVAVLVDCRRMTKADEYAARCELYEGAVAWVLEDVHQVEPFRVRGRLGLFDVDDVLVRERGMPLYDEEVRDGSDR